MANLIPLSQIPHRARESEAKERAKWPARAMALDAATYEIVLAEGCYSGAYAPTIGYVLTRDAAQALSERMTYMPGGSCHRRLRYAECASSQALGGYVQAIAHGADTRIALAEYRSAQC